MLRPNYLVVEGPDNMGKGFVVGYIAASLRKRGLRVFDAIKYQKQQDILPELEQAINDDAVIVCEPLEGTAYVRNEMLKNIGRGRAYSGEEVAFGMAFERMILLRKLVLPLLDQGKCVVSDRSLMASLVYQTLQGSKRLDYQSILAISANIPAVNNPPAYVLVVESDVDVALKRKAEREKKDECSFEEKDFMSRVLEGYRALGMHKIYEDFGTKLFFLDNTPDIVPGQRGLIHNAIDDVLADWLNGK